MFICVIIIILMLLLLMLGLPLFFALGVSSTVGLLLGKYPLTLIVSRMFYGIDSFSLLAIPFFVLTGELLSAGGGATRLINLSRALVGHIRGSLALINILASMFFGGVNGSASADIAAIGPILIPAMVKEGYPAGYSCIVTATSAQLGPIIPPSLLMIIYGSIAELSIGRLFLAGYLPGLILTLFLSIVAYVMAIKHDHPRTMQRASLNEIIKNLKESWLVLLVPLVIVLGIVFGFFTPTESGVFAATISFVVSFFIYKTLSLEDVRKCLNATMKTSGKLMLIISAAYIFSWILTRENFAQHLVNLISNISTNPNVTMLLVMLILLLAGSILESLASLIMFGPMLLEVGMKAGFNPIHFAIVVIMTILIGGVTPPVGVGLYLTASIARIPVSEVLKYLFPFLLALISAALVVAFIPWLTTWGLGL